MYQQSSFLLHHMLTHPFFFVSPVCDSWSFIVCCSNTTCSFLMLTKNFGNKLFSYFFKLFQIFFYLIIIYLILYLVFNNFTLRPLINIFIIHSFFTFNNLYFGFCLILRYIVFFFSWYFANLQLSFCFTWYLKKIGYQYSNKTFFIYMWKSKNFLMITCFSYENWLW